MTPPASQSAPVCVDVLVVGGGPVGLLVAYQLARSGLSVHVVDKDDKKSKLQSQGQGQGQGQHYGRANAIYSRSAELLDQLGLADDILQQCHVCREAYTYDERGERVVPGRVWNFIENIDDTVFDFAIMLRQQYVEEIFRAHLAWTGASFKDLTECVDIRTTDQTAEATLMDLSEGGSKYKVECKYLVGADGGKSFVRRHLAVPFEGDTTEDRWVRIDGRVKTNLPHPRAYGSIESPTHGNVLWAPLDHGCTRIGYVFGKQQQEACGNHLTQEVAVKEAIAAMKPFEVEFETVEWWTLYVIGQRVASTYRPHPRIFLAGDACHTHSSGAAQGLNTGIHDAVNLGWKLSLTLRGLASDDRLLETYDSERRAAAQRLIQFDHNISALMAGKWPVGLADTSGKDINAALAAAFDEASGFNTGLGLSYERNLVNVLHDETEALCSIPPGARAPDVTLTKPGTLERVRLQSATPNRACFYLLVFAGDPRMTLPRIETFAAHVRSSPLPRSSSEHDAVQTLTVVSCDPKLGTEEALGGVTPFSVVYFDHDRQAHRRYGVNLRHGALLVLRPDGHLAFTAELGGTGGGAVAEYLGRILK